MKFSAAPESRRANTVREEPVSETDRLTRFRDKSCNRGANMGSAQASDTGGG